MVTHEDSDHRNGDTSHTWIQSIREMFNLIPDSRAMSKITDPYKHEGLRADCDYQVCILKPSSCTVCHNRAQYTDEIVTLICTPR